MRLSILLRGILVCAASCGGSGGDASNDRRNADLDASAGGEDARAMGDASVPDGSVSGDADADSAHPWWQPGTGTLPWQWEIDHELSTMSTADMGTGDTTYTGAPAAAPVVYDIDGFNNTAADVAALHALGKKVIAYVEVGAAENNRPDYAKFPAAALGKAVPGYPSEKYVDINNAAVMAIIKARIAMCAQKGFDGVEPDIDDSYGFDTGFTIPQSQQIAYLTALSDYAHGLGLAWGLKNGGDGGDPATFIPAILPHVDFAVVEEPYYLKTIGSFEPAFFNAGKAMFVAEYTNNTTQAGTFCPQALANHTNAALFDVALNASVRAPCY